MAPFGVPPLLLLTSILFALTLPSVATAASASACATPLTPTNGIKPSIASGYQMALIATGLTKPRSIAFDSSGHLLVVQSGKGVSGHKVTDNGGTCIALDSGAMVVEGTEFNHGLAFSTDGKTLYASTTESAFSYPYDPSSLKTTGSDTTLVKGMTTEDHTTRTMLVSQKAPGMLVIIRGSTSNVDFEAAKLDSGHSQIRAFDLGSVPNGGYTYSNDGVRLGWGLRNSVGVGEHPDTGGIWSVENSVDEIERNGKNVHQDNPGEELNFHGYLNGTVDKVQGSNYGYPYCFSAWVPDVIPDNTNIHVGTAFAMGDQNDKINDTYCGQTTPARLTFQAHMAPLDIKFNNSGSEAWITFHGSWDRTDPVGYKLSVVPFANGQPVAAADNKTAAVDIFTNVDNSQCPDSCFRPVGMAFDKQGRLFMSSDASGEIYVIVKDQATNGTSTGTAPSPTTSPSSMTSASSDAGARLWSHYLGFVVFSCIICILF